MPANRNAQICATDQASIRQNQLLSRLPSNERDLLGNALETFPMPHRKILHEQGQPIDYLYYPVEGMISLVVPTVDGKSAEVNVVGNEGFVGIGAMVGRRISFVRAVVQVEGHADRIPVGKFAQVVNSAPVLQAISNRFAIVQGMQIAQIAACNRLHNVEQRLARWLLMSEDRVPRRTLPLTHEFLAIMLGTDRPSVSVAAKALQQKQAIQYDRGSVTILDRSRLESSSCECYSVMNALRENTLDVPTLAEHCL